MENIMKIVEASSKQTHYIIYPERIFEIHDTDKGCLIGYTIGGVADIEGVSARKLKRSIQEQLDEPLGYLKTIYTYGDDQKGLRYFNVDYIAAVHSHGTVNRNGQIIDTCSIVMDLGEHHNKVKIDHAAHEVAYQIKRVLKRLDQDEEICCAPETETETEAE